MDSYKIEWKRSAVKDLRRIDRSRIPQIIEAVEALSNDPFQTGFRKIHGTEQMFRIRVGDYRVVYEADTQSNIVVIYLIRHRKDAYRKSP